MTKPSPPDRDGADAYLADEDPANEDETRTHLLVRAKRPFAPIYKGFVQNPDKKATNRAGPLAQFIRNGDLRGLRAFLFLHAIISSGEGDNGWSTTLPLAVWARVFDTTKAADRRSASTAATKVLSRLAGRHLIIRERGGRARAVTVTLLRPDGTGAAYTRPDGTSDRFLKLSNRFWTDRWYDELDLPATAMLLVALHEKPGFELPTERMPEWYGFSADTAERGLKTLHDLGLLEVHKRVKKAPLSPTGATQVNIYTLAGPFEADERGVAPSKTKGITPPHAKGNSKKVAVRPRKKADS
ncbi:hypothetical protein [Terrabacter carboxydivorans]|uniref:Uncharacterized protein n=1 Tax=Terrabacter carboxydivorans TaxID=619730 RepID=A0ABN3MI65_9MICO